MSELDRIADELADMAINLGLNIEQIKECLDEASTQRGRDYAVGQDYVNDDESKGEEYIPPPPTSPLNVPSIPTSRRNVPSIQTLQPPEARQVMNSLPTTDGNNANNTETNPFYREMMNDTAFGRKILSKATESVRQIAKKKGIYIVGRKGNKFLGIRFTPKGNYSKNKKGRPNGKMYTLDGLRKMKKKRVSFKKLPQLIDMMDTGAVLKKHKDFKFGFELKKQPRGCSGFGYKLQLGPGHGKSSARLFGKL